MARALVGDPSLLLADCHGRGTTLCVVSHNPKFEKAADRTLRLSEGRLTS